jgi:hypothetical protein
MLQIAHQLKTLPPATPPEVKQSHHKPQVHHITVTISSRNKQANIELSTKSEKESPINRIT